MDAASTLGFEWSTSSAFSSFSPIPPDSIQADSSAAFAIWRLQGLQPGTTYYYRAVGKNSAGEVKGSVIGFTTQTAGAVPPMIELIYVQGGDYLMGSDHLFGTDDAEPIHPVTVSSFYIGKFEVTQAQWREVVEWKQNNGGTTLPPDPSHFKGPNLPVEQVSWNDIILWISHLNQKEARSDYRLPTEAEWEFAARGGNLSQGYMFSGGGLDAVAWWLYNANDQTHSVGTKMANELGIHDMTGNVWEFCHDWFAPYSSTHQRNPKGPVTGGGRVRRGSDFQSDLKASMIGYRFVVYESFPANDVGFRLAW